MRTFSHKLFLVYFLLAAGCTDPGETTAIGAAAGGALGAGLGAIIGSTTGDAGAGLVIGGTAGAGAGAALGNVIQSQEEALQSQEEALERQEQMIASQRKELNELRRLGSDSVSFSRSTAFKERSQNSPYNRSIITAPKYESSRDKKNTTQSARIVEQDIGVEASRPLSDEVWNRKSTDSERRARPDPKTLDIAAKRSAYETTKGTTDSTEPDYGSDTATESLGAIEEERVETQVSSVTRSKTATAECGQADEEVIKAESAAQVSDRLFHMRRALRLCPNNPELHSKLGSIYLVLNRKVDAEFEFEQALSIDPANQMAKEQLANLRASEG